MIAREDCRPIILAASTYCDGCGDYIFANSVFYKIALSEPVHNLMYRYFCAECAIPAQCPARTRDERNIGIDNHAKV